MTSFDVPLSVVGERFQARLNLVDLRDERAKLSDFAVVFGPEDFFEQIDKKSEHGLPLKTGPGNVRERRRRVNF